MGHTPSDLIRASHLDATDGIDRRGFLNCMAWVGTGVVFAMSGGVLASTKFQPADAAADAALERADFKDWANRYAMTIRYMQVS